MNKKYCFTLKSTCTSFYSSNCVDWVGNELTSINLDEISCEPSLTEIIEKLDEKISFLLTITDVSNLKECGENDYKLNHILEIYLTTILDLKKQVDLLCKKQAETLIKDVTFNIDTSCLTNDEFCYPSAKNIENLFKILFTEVCYLKNKIENG